MSNPGWYPDPGGQPGMYRYWTGSSWSAAITPNPMQTPPGPSLGQPSATQRQSPNQQPNPPRRRPTAWWLGVGVVVVALAVAVWFGVRWINGTINGPTDNPGSNPTESVCPKQMTSTESPFPHTQDGRVHGGLLSFPQLPEPWSAPEPETRVPFGRDVLTQDVMVEQNYDGDHSWVASVLVGELVAGDGFFSPQQGSEIVVKCIMGVFYDDAEVIRDDRVNKATTVDGKAAWLVETHLSFDIPNLQTKGELAIILIVATSDASSSIFYASIPDTRSDLVAPARQAMEQLKVGR